MLDVAYTMSQDNDLDYNYNVCPGCNDKIELYEYIKSAHDIKHKKTMLWHQQCYRTYAVVSKMLDERKNDPVVGNR